MNFKINLFYNYNGSLSLYDYYNNIRGTAKQYNSIKSAAKHYDNKIYCDHLEDNQFLILSELGDNHIEIICTYCELTNTETYNGLIYKNNEPYFKLFESQYRNKTYTSLFFEEIE